MAGRTRTTKKLAQRIKLDYFKTLHCIPRWRRILSAALTAAGLVWLGWHAVSGNPKPYDAGPVGHSHAMFSQKCGTCHVSGWFRRVATDQACLACHDGPKHHDEQTFAPACWDCHVEHRGALRLASTSTEACTQCHANLAAKDKNSPPKFAANIGGFDGGHPEFAAVRQGHADDPGTVAFNHLKHLKKELRGPHGTVELKCVDCHRPAGANEPLPFGQAQIAPGHRHGEPESCSSSAPPVTGTAPTTLVPASFSPTPFTVPGRAYMAPINYEAHCLACHPLQFDKRIPEPAPHKEPKCVYDFMDGKLREHIAAHPRDIQILDEPDKRLPPRPVPPAPRNDKEWVAQKLANAQILMWRKACKECHTLNWPQGESLPVVAKAAIPVRWLQHANFDHQAHQMVTCTSCHSKTEKSEKTSDVLLPGIQVCRQCHHSGSEAAEARCFECHTYHDWRKENRVNGKFTVPQLIK